MRCPIHPQGLPIHGPMAPQDRGWCTVEYQEDERGGAEMCLSANQTRSPSSVSAIMGLEHEEKSDNSSPAPAPAPNTSESSILIHS